MSFLTPFLLMLAGFAAAPVLLHLIRRKRIRVVNLPTFRFLKKAALEQRFHLRLQDQLLMLLRIVIIALLAMAFAGPGIDRPIAQDTLTLAEKNILILDDSMSMNVIQDGATLFQQGADIAIKMLEDSSHNWMFALASETLTRENPLEGMAREAEEARRLIANHPRPSLRAPMSETVQRIASFLDEKTALWLLTDQCASNWPLKVPEELQSTQRAHAVLLVGKPSLMANAGIADLSIANEPVFAHEIGLARVMPAIFGGDGILPNGIALGWIGANGQKASQSAPLSRESAEKLSLERLLPSASEVDSISASLLFPAGGSDILPDDNQAQRKIKTIQAENLLLLSSGNEASQMLAAALSGFKVQQVDWRNAAFADLPEYSCALAVLGNEPPHPSWIDALKTNVASGKGLLVFYDQPADGIRLETWSAFWKAWDQNGEMNGLDSQPVGYVGADRKWFMETLDPGAQSLEWASKGVYGYEMKNWSVECALQDDGGKSFALFQTFSHGEGLIGAMSVALLPETGSPALSPGWVPLLYQMIRRTFISLREGDEVGIVEKEAQALESDLRPLAPETINSLEKNGLRFHNAGETAQNIQNYPSDRADWTVLFLCLCLGLALLETGLSNYL